MSKPRTYIPRAVLLVGLALTFTAVGGGVVSARSSPAHKAPATPRPGRYAGFAGPFNLSFRVSSNSKEITHLVTIYNPAAGCGIPTSGESEGFPTLAVRKGRFTGSTSLRLPSGISVFFSIQGSFSTPTRASGTIHGHLTVVSLPPCNDHVPFSAQRVGK